MLDDIHLTGEQADLLAHAAKQAGGTLIFDYRGEFEPSGPVCIGLRAPSPGILLRFGAMVGIALALPDPLLGQMAARVCEDYAGNDASRVYYWPGLKPPASPGLHITAGQRARHLVAVHKNAAALDCDLLANWEAHHHEHHGPGGIRNHPYGDLGYDPAEVGRVLEGIDP
jgi:hypothetical protein